MVSDYCIIYVFSYLMMADGFCWLNIMVFWETFILFGNLKLKPMTYVEVKFFWPQIFKGSISYSKIVQTCKDIYNLKVFGGLLFHQMRRCHPTTAKNKSGKTPGNLGVLVSPS